MPSAASYPGLRWMRMNGEIWQTRWHNCCENLQLVIDEASYSSLPKWLLWDWIGEIIGILEFKIKEA